jgi:hypothetical protein
MNARQILPGTGGIGQVLPGRGRRVGVRSRAQLAQRCLGEVWSSAVVAAHTRTRNRPVGREFRREGRHSRPEQRTCGTRIHGKT